LSCLMPCSSCYVVCIDGRDPTLTTIVTLLSAYSSYYVADRLVGASGLLAVVCNGFTMSLIGTARCFGCAQGDAQGIP
jgi:NhaP-type Na+/H+ or K+/H+ antiporter